MRCTGYEMVRYKGTQASHLYEKSMHTLCTISEQPFLAEAATILDVHCGIYMYTGYIHVHCGIYMYTGYMHVHCGIYMYTGYMHVHCGIYMYTVVYTCTLWYIHVHCGIYMYTVVYTCTL